MKPYLSTGSRLSPALGPLRVARFYHWLSENEVKVYQLPEGGAIAKDEHDYEAGVAAECYDAVGLGLQQSGVL